MEFPTTATDGHESQHPPNVHPVCEMNRCGSVPQKPGLWYEVVALIGGHPVCKMKSPSLLLFTYHYGKFEAKASPFRAGMKPTNSI
jgi:hypothetical protein